MNIRALPRRIQPKIPNFMADINSIIKISSEMRVLREELEKEKENNKKSFAKLYSEYEKKTDELFRSIDNLVKSSKNQIDKKLRDIEISVGKIMKIQKGDKGDKGDSISKEEIVKEILSKIKFPEQPNEDKIINKALLEFRKTKSEIDPLAIIDEIIKLPKSKKMLKMENVDGLDQTISAFRNQLSRGYLHGGGLSSANIYTETPTGAINSVNRSYTTVHTITKVIVFSINGQYIHPNEYSTSGQTITMTTALDSSLSGKEFTVIYV